MTEPVISQLPEQVRDLANGLWRSHNERLDAILTGLRTDLLGRPPEDNAIAWVTSIPFMRDQISEQFAKDMLIIALYRLARYEADR